MLKSCSFDSMLECRWSKFGTCLFAIVYQNAPRKASFDTILFVGYHRHHESWWRHQMETFSALLAICAGNSPVPDEFPAQRPVMRSFDVFFDLRLNKRLSKQSWGWWFETLSRPLWRHNNDVCMPHRQVGLILPEVSSRIFFQLRISRLFSTDVRQLIIVNQRKLLIRKKK